MTTMMLASGCTCLPMTTNISPTSIVVEVLRDDNYGDWSACMKSYMLAHDLWDLIEPADHQEGDQEVDSTPIDHPEGDQEGDQEGDSTPIDHPEGDQEGDSTASDHPEGDSTPIDHPEGDQEGDQEVDSTPTDHPEGDQEGDSTPINHPEGDQEDDQEGDSTPIDHPEGDQEVDSTASDHPEGDQEGDSTPIDHPEGDQEGDSTPIDHPEGDQEVDSTPTDHPEGDQEGDSTPIDHPEGDQEDDQEGDSTPIDHPEGDQEGDQEGDSTPIDHPEGDQEGDQEVDSTPIDHPEGDQEIDSTPTDHREGDQEVDSKAWRKKNAAALHAIQISCSPRMLSTIRSIVSAKDAWDTLANSQQQHSPSHEVQSQGSGPVSNEMNGPLQALYRHAHRGDWDETEKYLKKYPNAIRATIEPYGETALHVAACAGNLKVVEELVKLMSEKDLEIQDGDGETALFCAAIVGITKMAECLVSKNQNLLTIVSKNKRTPLVEACIRDHKDMALYLYSVTPVEFLCDQDNGIHGSNFLQCAIGARMLDIAYDFLYHHPNMTTTKDGVHKKNAFFLLSKMPEIFPSGNRLALWQQWIYSCIPTELIATTGDNIRICMPDQSLSGSKNITLQVMSKLRGFAINLLTFLGIKQIYDWKKIHIYSDKILRFMCEYISNLDYEKFLEAGIEGAFHDAVKNDMVEFVVEVIKARPYVMMSGDDNKTNLFMSSLANRREKVFSLLYGFETGRALFVPLVDSSHSTMLHLAANLSPPSQLARISGAALQMQRELQWYKEVESIMNPAYKKYCDENNMTARERFTNEHKDLLVKGEQWMKRSATSCTVVGALIITIMFTAVFTVPGGNVQETGYPIFKDEKSFIVFIVADAISLFSSSTSVLMFLGILTSRYAEEDFLKSLPTKLIFGLSTLFLSIATMMVTFCAALIIMLNGRLEIIIPVVLLASIPVTFFMLLQFPLLVEIFVSTYGPGIFNKKIKRWY